jgi:hypothetical protein
MLVYSVCYYYGKNKFSNIINHVNTFLNINDKKIFIVQIMVDSHDQENNYNINIDISNKIKNLINNNKYKVLVNYNWGGTILGLWLAFNIFYNILDDNTYLAHFEEDFHAINNNVKWYKDCQDLFRLNNYIYIGETTTGKIKTKNDDERLRARCFKHSIRLKDPEVWTDGGFYFSTLKKWKIIEDKIGIFHKGDKNTLRKNNYILDGIDIGEVGFPTLVYHAGFKFYPLHREKYFIHDS